MPSPESVRSKGRRILLIGSGGQLGWELRRTLSTLGQVTTADRAGADTVVDLVDADAVRALVRGAAPHLVVNAAAYTAVDRAEDESDLAHRINAVAPGVLAEEVRRLDAAIVHFSTDYVFDGRKEDAYLETDAVNPLSVYGRTKLLGEQTVAAATDAHLIFRTSWVYGARGHNFLRTILRLAQEREELSVVDDQFGAPNWSRWLAQATAHVLTCIAARVPAGSSARESFAPYGGLYHMSCAGRTNWCGFAKRILELADGAAIAAVQGCAVRGIPSSDYPARAERPRNSALSTAKLAEAFKLHAPTWDDALTTCIDELAVDRGV